MNYKFPLDIIRLTGYEAGGDTNEKLPEDVDYFKGINIMMDELEMDPNRIEKWDELFNAIDNKYDELVEQKLDNGIIDILKSFAYKSYSTLLERFPLLTNYWKSWSIFEYKINGVESSINILGLSVQNFPTSIELWADFLSALTSQYESTNDETLKNEQIESIRFQYELAIKYNVAHYNAHIIWDKIFEFETLLKKDSEIIRKLLLRVIKIPLYEYSKYFKEYFEINKKFELNEVLDKDTLADYLSKFGKLTTGELSIVEKNQIIDDYSYELFNDIQRLVNEKWNFESALVYQAFSIKDITEIELEVENWIRYLDHEISSYQNGVSGLEMVENLFERALIPNCFNSKLWFKYLLFYHNSTLDATIIFEKMNSLYERCTQKYIPLNDSKLRTSYVDFLMSYEKFDEANEYIIDLIKMYYVNGSRTFYFKEEYLRSISKLMEVWFEISENRDYFTDICEGIIKEYFKKSEPETKKASTESISDQNPIPSKDLNKYKKILLTLLNDDSICLIINEFLNNSILISTAESFKKLRIFFNSYYRENAIEQSVKFWKFFIELEGLHNVNYKNLKNLMDYIKENVNLPKVFMDSLIDLYCDIINSSILLPMLNNNDDIVRSIIEQDMNKSKSLFINVSMRKRLAINNYHIRDLEDARSSKPQNQPLVNTGEEFLKISRKHLNHPGILVEALPEITNSILNEDNLYVLDTPRVLIPPLPTFKNVEKASLPINYPNE